MPTPSLPALTQAHDNMPEIHSRSVPTAVLALETALPVNAALNTAGVASPLNIAELVAKAALEPVQVVEVETMKKLCRLLGQNLEASPMVSPSLR